MPPHEMLPRHTPGTRCPFLSLEGEHEVIHTENTPRLVPRSDFNTTKRAYARACATHRSLYNIYRNLPAHIRLRDSEDEQLEENLSEFRQAPKGYADTFWGPMLSSLAKVLNGFDASFDELEMMDEFVEKANRWNEGLKKGIARLEEIWQEEKETKKQVSPQKKKKSA